MHLSLIGWMIHHMQHTSCIYIKWLTLHPLFGYFEFLFFSKLDTHYVVAVLLKVFRPIVK